MPCRGAAGALRCVVATRGCRASATNCATESRHGKGSCQQSPQSPQALETMEKALQDGAVRAALEVDKQLRSPELQGARAERATKCATRQIARRIGQFARMGQVGRQCLARGIIACSRGNAGQSAAGDRIGEESGRSARTLEGARCVGRASQQGLVGALRRRLHAGVRAGGCAFQEAGGRTANQHAQGGSDGYRSPAICARLALHWRGYIGCRLESDCQLLRAYRASLAAAGKYRSQRQEAAR